MPAASPACETRAIVGLLLDRGLRRAELLQLNVEDLSQRGKAGVLAGMELRDGKVI